MYVSIHRYIQCVVKLNNNKITVHINLVVPFFFNNNFFYLKRAHMQQAHTNKAALQSPSGGIPPVRIIDISIIIIIILMHRANEKKWLQKLSGLTPHMCAHTHRIFKTSSSKLMNLFFFSFFFHKRGTQRRVQSTYIFIRFFHSRFISVKSK